MLVTLARIGDEGGVSQRRLMDELGLTVRLGGAGLVAGTPTTATGGRTTRGRHLV